MTRELIKKRLKKLIDESGESIYKVSKETKISQTAIHEWVEGSYTPKLENLQRLAKHFDVPVTYFIE